MKLFIRWPEKDRVNVSTLKGKPPINGYITDRYPVVYPQKIYTGIKRFHRWFIDVSCHHSCKNVKTIIQLRKYLYN